MIDVINIELLDGTIIENVQSAQFQINDHDRIWCLGIDVNMFGGWLNFLYTDGSMEIQPLGKLEEINILTQSMTFNSLVRYGWDLDECPNPECVIITKT